MNGWVIIIKDPMIAPVVITTQKKDNEWLDYYNRKIYEWCSGYNQLERK